MTPSVSIRGLDIVFINGNPHSWGCTLDTLFIALKTEIGVSLNLKYIFRELVLLY